MLTKEEFALLLVERFPEYEMVYTEHLQSYGEILGHVLFAELNPVLFALLRENREPSRIRQYIDFVEQMYALGDDAVQNIVEVTILEYLGDSETVLRNAFTYFSEDLMRASQSVEALWGRREITVGRRRGKPYGEWKPINLP